MTQRKRMNITGEPSGMDSDSHEGRRPRISLWKSHTNLHVGRRPTTVTVQWSDEDWDNTPKELSEHNHETRQENPSVQRKLDKFNLSVQSLQFQGNTEPSLHLNNYTLMSRKSFNSPFLGAKKISVAVDGEESQFNGPTQHLFSGDRLYLASKALITILRHTFKSEGLLPSYGWYFDIEDVLGCAGMIQHRVTKTDVVQIVNFDGKSRFALAYEDEDIYIPNSGHTFIDVAKLSERKISSLKWIRANQGHSRDRQRGFFYQVSHDTVLRYPMDCDGRLHLSRFAFHGSSWSALERIMTSGFLSPMNRFHIHFSKSIDYNLMKQWNVKNELTQNDQKCSGINNSKQDRNSGLRQEADVAIIMDVKSYLELWPYNSSDFYQRRSSTSVSSMEDSTMSINVLELPHSDGYSKEQDVGHLRWEISKNDVVLCSGWHTRPTGVTSDQAEEGIPIELFYGVLDLRSGAIMRLSEVRSLLNVPRSSTSTIEGIENYSYVTS